MPELFSKPRTALVRRPLTAKEVSAEELLAAYRAKSQRLYVALAAILLFNLAIVSGVVTFWALALKS